MKLLDVNLLVYAFNSGSPRYEQSRAWLTEVFAGTETVALPWLTLLGFIRVSTRAAVVDAPLRPDDAMDVVDSWLALPQVFTPHPGPRHARLLRDLLTAIGTAGNHTTDAHLAALAIEHGAELCSSDVGFSRYPGLRWTDPLR